MSDYQVAVIGAGPGGYVSAIRCAQLGLKTVCIEKWVDDKEKPTLGGTCLNVGCIPSKALLDSTHLYETLNKDAKHHGINVKEPSLNLEVMHQRKDQIITNFSQGIAGLFAKNGVDLIQGSARFIDQNTLEVSQSGEVKNLSADNIIIATGSSPITLENLPLGESVVDNAGALNFDEVPVDLGIIGAGVIGLELGTVWRRLGANVTIFEMAETFLPLVDRDIADQAYRVLTKQGLNIKLGAKVTEADIDEDYVSITYEDSQGEDEIEFDKLIVAVGRTANTQGLDLERAGIRCDDRDFILCDESCRTNTPNIFAIGDVTSGPMLAHRASKDGILAAETISGDRGTKNYSAIPWVIYTSPEIAWCGETEQSLEAQGIKYRVGKFPFIANGRAHAMLETEGMVKILTAMDGQVLGLHILGPFASELISTGVTAVQNGFSYADIVHEIHAHPSLSEVIHEAALDIEDRKLHL